jgi:very-short-patch-repair endonuclease
VQHRVVVDGRFIARTDLAWPSRKVAIECDGIWHADAAQLHRDRRRLNRLVAAGWTVLHITSVRMHEDFDGVVAEIRRTLAGC